MRFSSFSYVLHVKDRIKNGVTNFEYKYGSRTGVIRLIHENVDEVEHDKLKLEILRTVMRSRL
jgi:hypothetical protein